jgi:putative tricarboxylic transport membrane protein
LLQIPRPYLYAGIVFFATLGAYSVNLQAFDLAILLVLGLLGFLMRRFGLPVLPLVLGVILGPRLEQQLRTSLQLSQGSISGLFSEPLAIVVYVIVALVLAWPLARRLRHGTSRSTIDTQQDAGPDVDAGDRGKVSSS